MLHTFDGTLAFMEQSVADLSEQQMVEQPAGVPNHAAWTLGHVIVSCQGIAAELATGPWLPDDWEALFGYGSTPLPDRSRYPSKAELLAALADAASRLRHILLAADPSALNRSLPDDTIPSMRHLLLQVVVAHTAYHAGQLAVWRRAIGKESVAVFV